MSFLSKTDYFSLTGTGSNLVIVSSDQNNSISVAEAQNEKGDVVATESYGFTMNPSCSYVVKGDVSLDDITLGSEISYTSVSDIVITNLTINTGAGTPPTITVSGEEVPTGTHCSEDCQYEIPESDVEPCHHAQALWGISFSSVGSGMYVTQANYTAECTLTKATKDGETVKYDITGGKLTATLTIQGTGSDTTPTINPTGWIVTSPISRSNPDGGYETYSVTFTKNLSHTTSSST